MFSNDDNEKLVSQLKGNTLRAYWAILSSKNETIGVRELQRKLNFSSPALASYHLNKLEEMGLIRKESGDYTITREINVGIFAEFVKLGTFRLPRFLMYSTFFSGILVFFLIKFREASPIENYAFVAIASAVIILWYETIRVWQQKP